MPRHILLNLNFLFCFFERESYGKTCIECVNLRVNINWSILNMQGCWPYDFIRWFVIWVYENSCQIFRVSTKIETLELLRSRILKEKVSVQNFDEADYLK